MTGFRLQKEIQNVETDHCHRTLPKVLQTENVKIL